MSQVACPHQQLPDGIESLLEPYLPPVTDDIPLNRPFVTLTYACSLDSKITAQPGAQTALSHLETKAMTHYLRSLHDAILVGIGTVLADDPGLNCRLDASASPRPIILDPEFRWQVTRNSRLIKTAACSDGLGPWVFVHTSAKRNDEREEILESVGGRVIEASSFEWSALLNLIRDQGIASVMVEGGAKVINGLLCTPNLIDSLVLTIAPVYLGGKGLVVGCADQSISKLEFAQSSWWTGTKDAVLAARLH